MSFFLLFLFQFTWSLDSFLTRRFPPPRATESTFRSLNNLLERFHQSFFLYIMTSIDSFVAVGNYLAAPILVGAAFTVQGLLTWSSAHRRRRHRLLGVATTAVGVKPDARHEQRRRRPVGKILSVVAVALVAASVEFSLVTSIDPSSSSSSSRVVPWNEFYLSSIVLGLHLAVPLVLSTLLSSLPRRRGATAAADPSRRRQRGGDDDDESLILSESLESTYLLGAGLLVSVTATVNYGLSCFFALSLAWVGFVSSAVTTGGGGGRRRLPYERTTARRVQQILMASLATPVGVWLTIKALLPSFQDRLDEWLRTTVVRGWKVSGGSSLPVVVILGTALELVLATSVIL